MRVLYDYQIFAAQAVGGISRYFVGVASHLAKDAGVTTRIIAPVHRNTYLRAAEPGLVVGRYVPPAPRTGRVMLAANTALFPRFASRYRPDVVHETYYAERPTYAGKSARVVTVFDMIAELYPDEFRGDMTASAKRHAVERADAVICISENTKRDLEQLHGLPAGRAVVVHLAYDPLDPGERRAHEMVGPSPYLLYVGARGGYKNFDRLMEAFAGSSALRSELRIVCFGGGALTPAERERARTLGLGDGQLVQTAGDDASLAALYTGAAAFVYPSSYEGFGIPPLEAMSLGCPVVCSDTGALVEVVSDAAELFEPGSAEAMSVAIENVVGSESRRAELIARGERRCRAYSWQRCAAETRAVYSQLVGSATS